MLSKDVESCNENIAFLRKLGGSNKSWGRAGEGVRVFFQKKIARRPVYSERKSSVSNFHPCT